MNSSLKNRTLCFRVEDGCLVRTVSSDATDGRTYTHRCSQAAFQSVAHAIEETPGQGAGTTLTEIARRENLPFTQVNVALEFLKERGIIEVRHRRCYPAIASVHLDAMIEFHALAEESKLA